MERLGGEEGDDQRHMTVPERLVGRSRGPAVAAVNAVIRHRRERLLAVTVVGVGAVANFLGALLPRSERILDLQQFWPVGLVIGGRALLVVLSLLMALLAWGLWHGFRRAWIAALVVSALSALLHLGNVRVLGAIISVALLVALAFTAPAFRVPTRKAPRRWLLLAGPAFLAAVVVYGIVVWEEFHVRLPKADVGTRIVDILGTVLVFSPPEHRYGLGTDAFIDSLMVLGGLFWVVLVASGLRTAMYKENRPAVGEVAAFVAGNGCNSAAPLSVLPGNEIMWLADGHALVGYKLVSGVAIAVCEPVAESGHEKDALAEFARRCDSYGWLPAMLAVTREAAEEAAELGFSGVKISEDPVVRLSEFTLKGKRYQQVRTAINRAGREGMTVERYEPSARSPGRDAELKRISDAWLQDKDEKEMGFTLGRFDPSLFALQDVYVAIHDGVSVAFCTWFPYCKGRGRAVDEMRRDPASLPGTMDFLFAEALVDMRERGVEFASLGGVALASTGERKGAAERSLGLLYDHGPEKLLYGKSLFRFKQKFVPSWEPQYLVYPSSGDLPRTLLAVARAYRSD